MTLTIRETWSHDGSPKATIVYASHGWESVVQFQRHYTHAIRIPDGIISVERGYVQEVTLR